ncbi:ATP-binding protein [Desulfovulcanus sp.]
MIVSRLFKKVLIYIIVIFIIMLALSSIYSAYILRKNLINEYISKANAIVNSISKSLPDIFLQNNAAIIQSIINQYLHVEGVGYVLVHDEHGRIIAHTFVPDIPDYFFKSHFDFVESNNKCKFVYINGIKYIDISRGILVGKAGFIHIGMKMDIINKKIVLSLIKIQSFNLLMFIISVVLLYLIIDRISTPLVQLTDYAYRLSRKEFNAPLMVHTNDEIGELAQTMRNMAKELSKFIDKLYDEKELFTVTLRSIGDGVVTTDKECRVNFINRVAEEILDISMEKAYNQNFDKVVRIKGYDDDCLIKDVVEKGRFVESKRDVLISAKGDEVDVAYKISPIYDRESCVQGAVMVFQDISESLRMEEERTRREKLDALGVLAGGIAHDFNNRLTATINLVELVKIDLEPTSKNYQRLDGAYKTLLRAKRLTQQLLTFASGGAPIKEATSVSELVTEVIDFTLAGSNIGRGINIDPELWPAEIDQSQIAQVLENLLVNAMQAMPHGGTVVVSAENFVLRDDSLPLSPGKYIRISVKDTGPGIPRHYLDKIFDPYFTTKEKGTGLGLASVYSIIKRHDGFIDVISEPGKGTEFIIYLPASDIELVQTEDLQRKEKYEQDSQPMRILIMDDEEEILEVMSDILDFLGHKADLARDGKEMLEKYREALSKKEPYDLVIMDLTIPGGMGGKEAIEELLKLDPQARTVVSSGYSQDLVMSEYKKYGFMGVLVKPYTINDLAQILTLIRAGKSGQVLEEVKVKR